MVGPAAGLSRAYIEGAVVVTQQLACGILTEDSQPPRGYKVPRNARVVITYQGCREES
jgi:hypothetical protein